MLTKKKMQTKPWLFRINMKLNGKSLHILETTVHGNIHLRFCIPYSQLALDISESEQQRNVDITNF